MEPTNAPNRPTSYVIPAFLIVIAFNTLVLTYFHNRFWWPPDEGVYAHVADRVQRGEVLNSDVEEIHSGYHNFIHAGAFAIFGTKLLSMRYPLVIVAFIQSCLIFLIFVRHDLKIAVIAALTATSTGVIQYLNPTPNWYCLLLVTLIIYCLAYIQPGRKLRLELIGVLVGSVYLFRQITGVFVAMGVLTYLLTEKKDEIGDGKAWLARGLIGVMLIGLVIYLQSATNPTGLLLVGIWPILILIQSLFFLNTGNKRTLEIILRVGAGCVVAALPLLIYHAAHRSLDTFFDDTVLRALTVSRFAYLKLSTYTFFQLQGLRNFLKFESFGEAVNGIYWLILPFCVLFTGAATTIAFRKHRVSSAVGAFPIIAVFYALVALLQQIPIYLFYSLPITFGGLFWLTLKSRKQLTWVLCCAAIFFSAISLYYHAGQPLTRFASGTIRGERVSLSPPSTLNRSGLWIEPESLRVYTELVDLIRYESGPNDTIFVLPNNPELYFLAERRNPFRFWNTAVGVRNDKEKVQVLEQLKREPPKIIVIIQRDRNNTPASAEIIAYVRANYTLIKTISDFEVYKAGYNSDS